MEIAAGTVKAGAADVAWLWSRGWTPEAKLEKPLERMAAQLLGAKVLLGEVMRLGLFWMYSALSEHSEAWRCMCAALQHFRAAWWLRPPWRGANLGGATFTALQNWMRLVSVGAWPSLALLRDLPRCLGRQGCCTKGGAAKPGG